MNKGRVAVAMSGGVDSSLAAALLKQEGYEVSGVYLRLWSEPKHSISDLEYTCRLLDIPLHQLNLEAEAISQLKTLLEDHPFAWYEPGRASLEAREEFIRERLRLFYVGITRARCWLTATWNTGRTSRKNVAALPFLEMLNELERNHGAS